MIHQETKQWLVGGRLSYADFRVATSLPFAERAGLPVEEFGTWCAGMSSFGSFLLGAIRSKG